MPVGVPNAPEFSCSGSTDQPREVFLKKHSPREKPNDWAAAGSCNSSLGRPSAANPMRHTSEGTAFATDAKTTLVPTPAMPKSPR
jgi:hypothetical protein